MIRVILQARSPQIAELIKDCAEKRISFDECCRAIAAMGYSTNSVYEMVIAAAEQNKANELLGDGDYLPQPR